MTFCSDCLFCLLSFVCGFVVVWFYLFEHFGVNCVCLFFIISNYSVLSFWCCFI